MTEETLSQDDLGFHAIAVQEIEAARLAQAEIDKLQRQIVEAQGLMRLWGRYLVEKYGLGPADEIDESGRIHRR